MQSAIVAVFLIVNAVGFAFLFDVGTEPYRSPGLESPRSFR